MTPGTLFLRHTNGDSTPLSATVQIKDDSGTNNVSETAVVTLRITESSGTTVITGKPKGNGVFYFYVTSTLEAKRLPCAIAVDSGGGPDTVGAGFILVTAKI